MNERIKLLAEQAWDATAVSPEFGHPISFAEKFAELIVLECLDVVDEEVSGMLGVHVMKKIAEHFGVK
jgi:hypothetical protein